jgi:bacteriocin-like protein
MDINVVENSDTCMNITMPALPFESYELSDEELSEVSGGGGFVAGMASGPPPTMGCGGSDDFRRRF